MTPPGEQDERMIAYLLGELPEAESTALEERYLAEESVFRQLLAIEVELHDAYTRGSLSPQRRLQFEQRLLIAPEQLRRLEFSRALIQAQSSRRSPSFWTGLPKLTVAAVGIAATLTITIAVWWTASHRPHPQVAKPAIEPFSRNRAPSIVAFTLVPGAARAGGEEPTIEIPGGTDLVRLTTLFGRDSYPSYHAVLRTPEGAEVWRKNDLHSQPGAATSAVLDIPAVSFRSAHYALTLSGDKPGGASEDIADYSFRVRKP